MGLEVGIVNELIKTLNLTPPINLYKVCEYLNIKIKYKPLKEADGYFILKNGLKIIALKDTLQNSVKERFTIAHELGHYLLPGHDCKTLCKFKNTDYIAKSKYNTKEKEANAFAAQLLMPDIFIKETLEKVMPNEIEKILEISDKYNVSLTSLLCKYIDISYESMAILYYKNGIIKWNYFDYDKFNYNINYCSLDDSLKINTYQEDFNKRYIKEDIDNKVFLSVFNVNEYEKILLIHIKYLNN